MYRVNSKSLKFVWRSVEFVPFSSTNTLIDASFSEKLSIFSYDRKNWKYFLSTTFFNFSAQSVLFNCINYLQIR